MEKIYSRRRIKIPQFNKEKNEFHRKTIKTMIVVLIMISVAITLLKSSSPIFEQLCLDKAKSIATIISNEETTKIMAKYEYEDIITIHKDKNENIAMIEANIVVINKIISDIAVNIQNKINQNEDNKVKLKIGSFTGSKLLASSGPSIPIKITTIGNVETSYRSEFSENGVNQTLHRIYVDIDCNVSILTPYKTITENIKNQVILAENIIAGGIPETYYNINGLQGTDVMEVME